MLTSLQLQVPSAAGEVVSVPVLTRLTSCTASAQLSQLALAGFQGERPPPPPPPKGESINSFVAPSSR